MYVVALSPNSSCPAHDLRLGCTAWLADVQSHVFGNAWGRLHWVLKQSMVCKSSSSLQIVALLMAFVSGHHQDCNCAIQDGLVHAQGLFGASRSR